jgi:transposase
MYISLGKVAKKYDFSTKTIKNWMANMKENVHYEYFCGNLRFHEEKLHKFLRSEKEQDVDIDISSFLR